MSSYGQFAKIYDVLMSDVNYDAWAEYLVNLIGTCDPCTTTVTDLACGTAAISIRLAKHGFRVTGIDISTDMLNVANMNALSAGVQINFVAMDMRKFVLHRACDVITCACDGVNYLLTRKDVDMFLRSCYDALKPGGLLLFDISTRHKLMNVLGNNTFGYDDGEHAYIWQNTYDTTLNRVQMDLTFFDRERDGRFSRFTETHVQSAHTVAMLTDALNHAGFQSVAVYGALTNNPLTDTDQRAQLVAKRD